MIFDISATIFEKNSKSFKKLQKQEFIAALRLAQIRFLKALDLSILRRHSRLTIPPLIHLPQNTGMNN